MTPAALTLILAVLNRISNPKSYDPGTGNYNQFWLVDRDWHDRRTALITDPRDGRIPAMTPSAQQKRAADIEQRRAHAFEDPEVFPLGGCRRATTATCRSCRRPATSPS